MRRLISVNRLQSKLTTVLSFPNRGPYGKADYRGNCSGYIQKALFEFFQPKKVGDFMAGSNTTGDVCEELGIDYLTLDLNPELGGFDILSDEIPESFDFIFSHDPYHDIIKYSGNVWGKEPDPRDLSRCKTYEEFIEKVNQAHAKMYNALRYGGHLAILTGDIKKKGILYSLIKDMQWYGLPIQHIIKVQHNCSSDSINYSGKFIPIVHEHLLIFKKNDHYIIRCTLVKTINIDTRNRTKISWYTVVLNAMQKLGGRATLQQLYHEIKDHAKTKHNKHWQEKVRQTLQRYSDFRNIERGVYELVPLETNKKKEAIAIA